MTRSCGGVVTSVCLSFVLAGAPTLAQQGKPDNTAVNKTDRSGSKPTAEQQSNTQSDITITRDIRRAIVADKNLSTYAHNVKVVTEHGQVTLRGPVRTPAEKQQIEAKAAEIAGAGHVKNELSIAPATKQPTKTKT